MTADWDNLPVLNSKFFPIVSAAKSKRLFGDGSETGLLSCLQATIVSSRNIRIVSRPFEPEGEISRILFLLLATNAIILVIRVGMERELRPGEYRRFHWNQ